MARPITLFTIQYGDMPLEELCMQAQKMGFDGLELSAAHLDMKRAATDMAYVQEVKDLLKKYGLNCWAVSHHLAGQCVCDTIEGAYDSRLDGFAPAELAGKPEEIQKWAIEEMKATAHAAKNMGVKVVTFFMGSPIWKFWYSFPQTSEEMIDEGFKNPHHGRVRCLRRQAGFGSPSRRNRFRLLHLQASAEGIQLPRNSRLQLRPQPSAVAGC